MKRIFSPSMMCVDFSRLNEELKDLNEAGVDMLHIDIMDGSYVPNISLGINDIDAINRISDLPMDVHLMIENPINKLDWFARKGVEIIYIHPDSERYTVKALLKIRELGIKAGIAINPDISFESLAEILKFADYILIMTVSPGFAGQKYIYEMDEKIEKFVKCKDRYNYKIIIDGALSKERIMALSKLGADGFVLGTSGLFGKVDNYKKIMKELRSY